jgi:hypothetical protein
MSPAGAALTNQCIVSRRADPAMVKALALAFRWKRMLDTGRYASISEIDAAEKIDRGYAGSILRLILLAPDIIEAILDSRQPSGMALADLLRPFPLEWNAQWAMFLTEVQISLRRRDLQCSRKDVSDFRK